MSTNNKRSPLGKLAKLGKLFGKFGRKKSDQIDFTLIDMEAEKVYGLNSAKSIEKVALLSLWNHAQALFPDKYSYVGCLNSPDKLKFQRRVIDKLMKLYSEPNDRRAYVLSKVYNYDEWRDVMQSITLSANYKIWHFATERIAYGCGSSTALTNLHAPLGKLRASKHHKSKNTVNVLYASHLQCAFDDKFWVYPAYYERSKKYRDICNGHHCTACTVETGWTCSSKAVNMKMCKEES